MLFLIKANKQINPKAIKVTKSNNQVTKQLPNNIKMSIEFDYNARINEYMAKMPSTLNTKKEIDEYYKAGWKEIKGKVKEEKKIDVPNKRVKKNNIDKDGNEIDVVKKQPNAYNNFVKDERPKIKEDYPNLNNKEIFSKIAEMWKKHKENIKTVNNEKEDDHTDNDINKVDDDINKVDDDIKKVDDDNTIKKKIVDKKKKTKKEKV